MRLYRPIVVDAIMRQLYYKTPDGALTLQAALYNSVTDTGFFTKGFYKNSFEKLF